MTTIRDMSYWLELEQQKFRGKMQTLAFASAAHEFKNPLSAIVSSLDLLGPLLPTKESSSQYFQIARSCANLMLFLVRDFLDFSQIDAQSFILDIQPCNLVRLIKECLDVLRFKADQKGIGLSFVSHGHEGNVIIVTDENRLRQIMINFLSNAIKYTENGSVKVEISVSSQE